MITRKGGEREGHNAGREGCWVPECTARMLLSGQQAAIGTGETRPSSYYHHDQRCLEWRKTSKAKPDMTAPWDKAEKPS